MKWRSSRESFVWYLEPVTILKMFIRINRIGHGATMNTLKQSPIQFTRYNYNISAKNLHISMIKSELAYIFATILPSVELARISLISILSPDIGQLLFISTHRRIHSLQKEWFCDYDNYIEYAYYFTRCDMRHMNTTRSVYTLQLHRAGDSNKQLHKLQSNIESYPLWMTQKSFKYR